ncbi:MAG TPA: AMP-binding protein [Mycobacteriales bacterium]
MTSPAVDFVSSYAESQPDWPAVVEGDAVMTWAQLEQASNRWANTLLQHGVTANTKIVWCGMNSTEVVVVITAARKAGAVAVPLNYRLSPAEAGYVIDNSDATVVLFDVEQVEQMEPARELCPKVAHWLVFRANGAPVPAWAQEMEALAADCPASPPPAEAAASGATMIYTSGTTGKPKGALRRGGNNPEQGMALFGLIGYQPRDVYLTTGPLYHSGPLGFMAPPLMLGGTVVIQRKFDPEGWLRLVSEHRVTTTFSAPTPIRRVLDLPADVIARYDTSSLARFIANAAPWPFELKRRYVEAFGDTSLWEVYGSTELGVDTVMAPADQMRKPGSCGRPAPMMEIALFDEDGELVTEPRVPGELFVRGAATFDTYYKAEEKFEASRRGDWLTVGDVAYVDEEGYYYICDRKNDMIISGGMNIYPAEIEAALLEHPAVVDAAVFGVPSEEWGEAVQAVIVVTGEVTDEDLTAFCRERLARYKVPRGFERVEEIPRTASGKTLKRELREPYWADQERQVG